MKDPCYKTSRRNATVLGKIFPIFLLVTILFCSPARAEPPRFFLMGDGTITVAGQSVTYRTANNTYLPEGLQKIGLLFRSPWTPAEERLSLRFIEILDYVQDQLQGKNYSVRSGYRSPNLNQKLRNQGKLAAQSSMHIEGAAGDLILIGVSASEVFDFVKGLDCCGIGWYHSKHFHLDTGPSRYWSETTSKTEDKSPQQNEKVILQADFDRYRPGEEIALKFMRVTQYPIGIPSRFTLVSLNNPTPATIADLPVHISGQAKSNEACVVLSKRGEARSLQVKLPEKKIAPGKYGVQVQFCNRYQYEKMPETIVSRPFEITP